MVTREAYTCTVVDESFAHNDQILPLDTPLAPVGLPFNTVVLLLSATATAIVRRAVQQNRRFRRKKVRDGAETYLSAKAVQHKSERLCATVPTKTL